MDTSIIGIGSAIGVSSFMLYNRKTDWMRPKIVWLICIGFFTLSVYGLFLKKAEFRSDKMMYFGFSIPLVYWTFDRLFRKLVL